mmetsp:Transcript_40987/g.30149  ORF Transcript_40987/g.30149 Transcript_40987/m.30149 type:complete len:152 (+) Transcript_40987:198-653(+)|eukprot:CAMPEP_0202956244 /NCGR_PEP_ID=MMETSP1396-20130829/759_1 /ASSEMBLY_ACC=CAM_ASM_000872 /TAXON_ID= /ORGANISM="Pseudokeronopsis sp., Strain Brazil" /LENGTH=151 /DNA_ID=CAMNT_0049673169 /DNA_START=204 /DNA_END=659 /DNA_ORIENTATION=-
MQYTPLKDKKLEDVGNTLRLEARDAGHIEIVDIDGKGPYRYHADHFHFHSPAEHTLNGERYDMELHIVHELVDGPDFANYHEKFCVLGLLFQISDTNHPFVEQLNASDIENIEHADFNLLFENEAKPKFFHYKGSLTTPPCTDVVNWFVYS